MARLQEPSEYSTKFVSGEPKYLISQGDITDFIEKHNIERIESVKIIADDGKARLTGSARVRNKNYHKELQKYKYDKMQEKFGEQVAELCRMRKALKNMKEKRDGLNENISRLEHSISEKRGFKPGKVRRRMMCKVLMECVSYLKDEPTISLDVFYTQSREVAECLCKRWSHTQWYKYSIQDIEYVLYDEEQLHIQCKDYADNQIMEYVEE